jgi:hypothetical protein
MSAQDNAGAGPDLGMRPAEQIARRIGEHRSPIAGAVMMTARNAGVSR